MDYNILSWLIWLPVIGVAAIAFIPRDKVDLIKIVSAVATGFQFLLTLILWKIGKWLRGYLFIEVTINKITNVHITLCKTSSVYPTKDRDLK